jgi:ABC-2 type transport system permease protein
MGFFIPGTAALILLFTAIFSTISIIEDRREGFLQGVLVSPSKRWGIAIGKALGGAAIAWAQSAVYLVLAVLIGMVPLSGNLLVLGGFLFLAALALTAMGVCFAWPMESTQGYHAAMNLVMLPMWMLSGAFFPIPAIPAISEGMPIGQRILQLMMQWNPMSYIVAGIRHLSTSGDQIGAVQASGRVDWVPTMAMSWLVTSVFALMMMVLATALMHRRQKGEFQ